MFRGAPSIQNDLTLSRDSAGKVRIGTGLGSPGQVGFNASTFAVTSPCFTGPGSRVDEILFHEMTHAQRKMAGVAMRTPLVKYPGMTSFEEFVAVTTTNTYRSEMFETLRRHHAGFGQLPKSLENERDYFNHYKDLFHTWLSTQPDFCVALAGIKVKFNPVRIAVLGR